MLEPRDSSQSLAEVLNISEGVHHISGAVRIWGVDLNSQMWDVGVVVALDLASSNG